MYISFFHGRKDPEQHMVDWGYQGPVVGPLAVSWTYGQIKIHDPDYYDMDFLPDADGLIHLGDDFFGDFEIWEDNDPLIEKAKEDKRTFYSYDEFVNKFIK